jgi:signal transduction histidine kinase
VVVISVLVFSLGGIALWSLQRSLKGEARRLAEGSAELAATLVEAADPSEPLAGQRNRQRLMSHLRRLQRQDGVLEVLVVREGGERLKLGSSRVSSDPAEDPDLALCLAGSAAPTRPGEELRAYRTSRIGHASAAVRVTVSPSAFVGARLGPTRRTLLWLAILDGVLVLIFGMVFLARRILGPLARMERASARVAAGDVAARLPEEGEGELGRVASRFNEMLDRLAEKDRRHGAQRVELEAKQGELEAKQLELDQSWEMLLGAAKLASVGRLTAGVAHELGNPMSAILGYLELLGDPEASEEDRRAWLGRVKDEIHRMDRTIRALLQTARPGDGELVRTDLAGTARAAAELAKHEPRLRNVDIRLGLEGLPPVAASSRLSQVFVNLLLNAGDALSARGEVRIRGEARGEQVLLWVEDDGPGIPAELRTLLFDPFVTSKAPGDGTGLGLAICQSILEASGGRISLTQPQPERGASFEIRLKAWAGE